VPPVVVVPPVSNVTVPPALDETNTPVLDKTDSPVVNESTPPIISDIQEPKPAKNTMQTVMNVISIVWLAGIAAMAIYTAVSYYLLRKKIDTAVRFRDNIYKSENVDSPFVVGVIKPKIYLPFNIKEQDAEYVIAHENAHIKRLDYIWKPLGFILLTVYWFNPVMWLGYILLCRDIELACDEKVIAGFDSEQRADYSEALLSCSVNRKVIAACPIAFGEVGVKDRIKSVLNYKKPALWIIILAVVAIIATALCFLTDPVSKKDSQENEETESGETDAPENSENTENEVSDLFLDILNNKKTYINESGEAVYLKHFKDGEFAFATSGKYVYATIDIDSDGTNEMAVTNDRAYGDYILFRMYDSKVYGYEFGNQEILELFVDGSIRQKDSLGKFIYFNLKFDGISYQLTQRKSSSNASAVKWNEGSFDIGALPNTEKHPETPKAFSYANYYDFLIGLCSNNPEKIASFFVKDIDNNGVEELIVHHDNSMECSFYTIDNGVVKLIEKYDFLTGTTRLLETNDEAYPGLICFTVGGGANHYVYLTIKDGQLSFEKIWDDNYSPSHDTPTTEYTTDKKLIEVSANAYNNNQDIDWVGLTLFAVLNSKMPYIDETGKSVYLKDFDTTYSATTPVRFAMVNFDGEEYAEMVVSVRLDGAALMVFREDMWSDKVYGYQFNFRQMAGLKKDGTFARVETSRTDSISRLEFEGTTYKVIEKAYADTIMDIYRLDGVDTTREEYIKYYEESVNVPYLRWIFYIDNPFVPTSEELNNAYMDVLNSRKPFIDYSGNSVYLNNHAVTQKIVITDLNSDGIDEMVVRNASQNPKDMVFHYFNGRIYGKEFVLGTLQYLKNDGRYLTTNDDGGKFVYSLEFDGPFCNNVMTAYSNQGKKEYRLNGVSVSVEELSRFYEDFNAVSFVNWVNFESDKSSAPDDVQIQLSYILKSVLYSQKPFIDESGNAVYLKDHKFVFDGSSMPVIEYTTVDMDNDGEKELIVNVGPEGNQMFVMVFRIYNGNVYGYQFVTRALYALKTDGSFSGSESAFINSIHKLEFEGTSYKVVELEYSNSIDNVYRLNGVNVTKAEVDTFNVEQSKIPYVEWAKWSNTNVPPVLPTADQLTGVEEPFLSVLTGKTTFIDSSYYEMNVSDYFEAWPMIGYTFVDFNQDGQNEIVVEMSDVRFLLLYKNGNSVTGSVYGHRTLGEIYTNGIYAWHQQTGKMLTYGLGTFKFSGNKAIQTELCHVEQNDTAGTVVYYVGEKQVSKEEYDAFYSQNTQQRVVWIKLQENQRDIGQMQTETQDIILIDGKRYQSYVASNADLRYIFISADEYPTPVEWIWDWVAIGTANEYSLELIGKVDEGRIAVDLLLVNYFKKIHEEYKDSPYTAGSYALYDMNGDGTNELLYWDNFHLVVCAFQNGVVKTVYYDGFNAMNGPIVVLENGAILSRNDGTGSFYYYETLNADYTITRVDFGVGEFGEYGNFYSFEGKDVSKDEWLNLTKSYFDIPEAAIEWLSLDKDPTVPEHEFYIDVNFDSKLDKLVPYMRPASGVYYKAYVWNEEKGDYVYAEGFENCPNISIDTERKVLLSHRTASMITSYSIITFDGMKFDSNRGIYWEPAENYTKIHFVEKEYIREPDYPWEKFCKSYLEVEHKNVNVGMAGLLTPAKTDEQIKGYFESGSLWDLDGARWKNYIFNMDTSDWWKF